MTETFSSAQVCAATTTSYRQVDNWLRCGYLDVAAAFPGSGKRRVFTFKEALQVAVLAELANAGVHPYLVNPRKVIANHGVYREDWGTVTIDMTPLIKNLAAKLGATPETESP